MTHSHYTLTLVRTLSCSVCKHTQKPHTYTHFRAFRELGRSHTRAHIHTHSQPSHLGLAHTVRPSPRASRGVISAASSAVVFASHTHTYTHRPVRPVHPSKPSVRPVRPVRPVRRSCSTIRPPLRWRSVYLSHRPGVCECMCVCVRVCACYPPRIDRRDHPSDHTSVRAYSCVRVRVHSVVVSHGAFVCAWFFQTRNTPPHSSQTSSTSHHPTHRDTHTRTRI